MSRKTNNQKPKTKTRTSLAGQKRHRPRLGKKRAQRTSPGPGRRAVLIGAPILVGVVGLIAVIVRATNRRSTQDHAHAPFEPVITRPAGKSPR
ncbi:MAG: hypothetical protein ACTIC1_18705 [Brevibacterium sp.]